MLYFKYKDKTHSWVLPVYENTVMQENPDIMKITNPEAEFIGEVTESEYKNQFVNPQQEFDFG